MGEHTPDGSPSVMSYIPIQFEDIAVVFFRDIVVLRYHDGKKTTGGAAKCTLVYKKCNTLFTATPLRSTIFVPDASFLRRPEVYYSSCNASRRWIRIGRRANERRPAPAATTTTTTTTRSRTTRQHRELRSNPHEPSESTRRHEPNRHQ